jgi:hypothetical protein
MRYALAFATLLACTAAAAAENAETQRLTEPRISRLQGAPGAGEAICRDRVHTVREERGLPRLERDTADPEEPLLFAAVDHRIDGCSVLVMKHDSRDVRPIPKPDEKAPLFRRAQ